MLIKAGFTVHYKKGKGSHRTYYYPSIEAVLICGNEGKDAQPYQEKEVKIKIKQARSLRNEKDKK